MTIAPPPPPPLDQLPYGTKLKAGLGESTVIADFDFETYSEAGYIWNEAEQKWEVEFGDGKIRSIGLVGAQNYAEHPSTEILCCYYDLKDGKGERLWFPGCPPPQDLFDHLASGKLLEAWNVAFEQKIWDHVAKRRYGWPDLPYNQLRCAMAKSRANCYPGALGKASAAANLATQKDKDGTRLLNKFSIPRNPTKKDPRKRITLFEDLEDGFKLFNYCRIDIKTEAGMSAICPDLIPSELEYWLMDQECNRDGLQLDMESVKGAISILDGEYERAVDELQQITEGAVRSPGEVKRIVAFLAKHGVATKSIDADNLELLLAQPSLPPVCRRVLEVRQSVGSAAVKKFYTMLAQMTSAGRTYDAHAYHAARTGRDAGQGIQVQNMPNSGLPYHKCTICGGVFEVARLDCPHCYHRHAGMTEREWDDYAVDCTLSYVKSGTLGYAFKDRVGALSGCIRGMIIADDGQDFIGSDFSSIEAVVAAMLTGEQWRIDVFRRKGDIYLESASRITGTPVAAYEQHQRETGSKHPHRKLGKVAELASGFGGWINSWLNFGAGEFINTEEEIKRNIQAWRAASPAVVEGWGGQVRGKPWDGVPELYGLEGLFIKAVLEPGVPQYWRHGVHYIYRDANVYCVLPSGRAITYHNVSLHHHAKWQGQYRICFWGYNSNPKMGKVGWVQLDTYGGRLFENVVQAVARDIMANAGRNLNRAGYKVRLRVHDEIITCVPEGWGSVEEMEGLMEVLPVWAAGWPVRASGGYRGKRFKK